MFKLLETGRIKLRTGFPITQAVIDGSQTGSIYQYEDNYFIKHKSGFCSYIQKSDCFQELISLFKQNEIPQYFHIYDANDNLIESVINEASFNCKIRDRLQFTFLQHEALEINALIGLRIEPINDSNFELLSQFKLDLEFKYWNNRSEFINSANGVVVLDDKNGAVGICYAAAIGDNKAEIDVLTSENLRGKGIAKLAVSNFINNCIKKNLIPNWDCFENNIASVKTAEQFSFKLKKSYKLLSIFKKNSYEN